MLMLRLLLGQSINPSSIFCILVRSLARLIGRHHNIPKLNSILGNDQARLFFLICASDCSASISDMNSPASCSLDQPASNSANPPLHAGPSLWAAHVGDSRAVMCRNGAAVRLTQDHKPVPGGPEAARIEAAGGRVDFQHCWRVVSPARGNRPASGLAVSRALGDISFKEPVRCVRGPLASPGDAMVAVLG